MPITGIGSYAPTMQDFLTSWNSVNATLGATPLTLKGAYTAALFTTDRTNIINAINAAIVATNTEQLNAATLNTLKAPILARAVQFRRWVQSYLPNTPYAQILPDAPKPSSAESKFLDPLTDIQNLWTTINADATLTGIPLPIALTGGYLAAAFTTDLTALRTAYANARNTSEQAALARKQRDALLKPAEQRMVQYRGVIEARFAGTPFEASLPALSPPPGSTPNAVFVTGGWNASKNNVGLQWEASDNKNLLQYEIRGCTGMTYKASNEFAVATVTEKLLTWTGTGGVPVAGAKCIYRVYVVLTTGNEKGSNNVAVTRP